MNTVTTISAAFTYTQMAMIAVLVLLFAVTAIKKLGNKKTGTFEVLLVAIVPVLLYFMGFFNQIVK